MIPSIPPIGSSATAAGIQPAQSGVGSVSDVNQKTETSGNLFEGFLAQTNQDQKNSDTAIQNLVEGKADSVQQVVMAVAKAEMSFELFMEIRNKVIDSYTELMRMQF